MRDGCKMSQNKRGREEEGRGEASDAGAIVEEGKVERGHVKVRN